MLVFAYHLRKHDADNTYSMDFLNGQVRPNIFIDIIMANQWNKSTKSMTVDKNTAGFSINIGQPKQFLQYLEGNDSKRPGNDQKVVLSKELKKNHLNNMFFLLTPKGLVI